MIELVNEDGTIIGRDSETGETVPVNIESLGVEDERIGESLTDPAGVRHTGRLAGHGPQPLEIRPYSGGVNPVLTADDVSDVSDVEFVADPFVVHEGGVYHMFMEARKGPNSGDYGVISHATSADGLDWDYQSVVLDEGAHISFPLVFQHDGTWYMMLESRAVSDGFRLYKADSFPSSWSLVETITSTTRNNDPVIFQHDGTWYLLGGEDQNPGIPVWHSDDLVGGSWTEHADSPILTSGPETKRCAGRPIIHENHVDLMVMDTERKYGDKVRCYRLEGLTSSSITTSELPTSPLIEANLSEAADWRSEGMHHLDASPLERGDDLVIVDGQSTTNTTDAYKIGVYRTGPREVRTQAYLSADQTVSDTVGTAVGFDSVYLDTRQAFDTSNNEFVAPVNGYYQIEAAVMLSDATSSPFRHYAAIRRNGGDVAYGQGHVAVDENQTITVSRTLWLESSDTVDVKYWQNSGTSQVLSGSPKMTYLEIALADRV